MAISVFQEDFAITCFLHVKKDGRTSVILTRYKEQAKYLYDNLQRDADYVFILYGDNSDIENSEVRKRLKEVTRNQSLILVATGQKIGEGFDYPRLDTLMLAAPVSFEGRLEQYIGRLNRDYEGKKEVIVYDYVKTGDIERVLTVWHSFFGGRI